MSALIAGDRAGSGLRCRFGSHAVSLRIGLGWPDCSSWAPSCSRLCSTGLRFALFSRGEVRCVLDRLAGRESPVLRQRSVCPLRWLATDLVAVHAPWRVRSIAVSGFCSPFQANRALVCRSGSASPLSHPRSYRRRSARELVPGFEPVGPRHRLFLVSSRDGTSRLQRRCSAFFAVPSVLARASERRLVASVHGLRRGRAVRRSRAGSSVRSLHAVACQSGWRTVVGRSAAISVRRGDRGLSFANSGSPVSRPGTGVVLLRSISFSTLQAASAVVAARLGSASGMGSVVVGPSAGSFGFVRPGSGVPKKPRCRDGARRSRFRWRDVRCRFNLRGCP